LPAAPRAWYKRAVSAANSPIRIFLAAADPAFHQHVRRRLAALPTFAAALHVLPPSGSLEMLSSRSFPAVPRVSANERRVGQGIPPFDSAGSEASSGNPVAASPAVIFLPVRLGSPPAWPEVQRLKTLAGSVPIIAVIETLPPPEVGQLIRAGAAGCLRFEDPPEEWSEAIRSTLCGQHFITHSLTSDLLKHALQVGSSPAGGAGVNGLTDRELAVLELLGSGLTTHEIAGRLGVSFRTIESHRENIKHRLGLPDAAALAHFACAWVERTTCSWPSAPAEPHCLPARGQYPLGGSPSQTSGEPPDSRAGTNRFQSRPRPKTRRRQLARK
jgi:DNA-binding NarL/FixJ family response regulator